MEEIIKKIFFIEKFIW